MCRLPDRGLFLFVMFCFCDVHVFLLNSSFFAFYKENQGLEVPRETRLEKLMRLLKVSSEIDRGKAELSRINI